MTLTELDLHSVGFLAPAAVAEPSPQIFNPRVKLDATEAQAVKDGRSRVWLGANRLTQCAGVPWLARVGLQAQAIPSFDSAGVRLFMAWATPGLSVSQIGGLWDETTLLSIAPVRSITTSVGILPGVPPDISQLTFTGSTLGGTDGGRGWRSLRAPAWSGPEGHLALYWALVAPIPEPEQDDTLCWLFSYEIEYRKHEGAMR